jgi:hypothetical protein
LGQVTGHPFLEPLQCPAHPGPLFERFISFQPSTASLYFSVLAAACNECFIIFAARIIVIPIDDSVAPVFYFFRAWSLVEVLSGSSNLFIFWAFCFYFGS